MTIIFMLLVIIATAGGYYYWHIHMNYNFGTITKGRVYKSGAIKPGSIENYTSKHNIKTIIDLRSEQTKHSSADEAAAIEKIDGVTYHNIPSSQIPGDDNLNHFFEILDNEENYPLLIHCYHGTGRTMLYVALYYMEYLNLSNEQARRKTRLIVESPLYNSAFAKGKKKGDFLINYSPRYKAEEQTSLETIYSPA